MALVILFPIVFSVILALFWTLYKICSSSDVLEKYFICVSITLTYFLSPVISSLADFFNCTKFDTDSYITKHLWEKCTNNPRYFSWRLNLALPGFLFYGLFFPLVLFVSMFKDRNKLFEAKLLSKFGFLLNGYSSNKFYW